MRWTRARSTPGTAILLSGSGIADIKPEMEQEPSRIQRAVAIALELLALPGTGLFCLGERRWALVHVGVLVASLGCANHR